MKNDKVVAILEKELNDQQYVLPPNKKAIYEINKNVNITINYNEDESFWVKFNRFAETDKECPYLEFDIHFPAYHKEKGLVEFDIKQLLKDIELCKHDPLLKVIGTFYSKFKIQIKWQNYTSIM